MEYGSAVGSPGNQRETARLEEGRGRGDEKYSKINGSVGPK